MEDDSASAKAKSHVWSTTIDFDNMDDYLVNLSRALCHRPKSAHLEIHPAKTRLFPYDGGLFIRIGGQDTLAVLMLNDCLGSNVDNLIALFSAGNRKHAVGDFLTFPKFLRCTTSGKIRKQTKETYVLKSVRRYFATMRTVEICRC